jgi:hypothetical protein
VRQILFTALRKFARGAAENAMRDFLRGRLRFDIWHTFIAGAAEGLSCKELPRNTAKEHLVSCGVFFICRSIDVRRAGTDFIRCFRGRILQRRRRERLLEILPRGRDEREIPRVISSEADRNVLTLAFLYQIFGTLISCLNVTGAAVLNF